MDVVFLILSVLAVVYTANALRPIGVGRAWLSGLSFMSSWLLIEFAWLVLALEVVVAGLFVQAGALSSAVGWLALGLSVLSWVGLALIILRGLWTSREIVVAFEQLDLARRPAYKLPITRIRNVVYGTVGDVELRLDVWRPRDPEQDGKRRPALLQVHGGAWVAGDKREQGRPLMRHLAAQGWVVFNANYRLSPRATFPDHLVDLKRAVAFIREHADDYGVDPGFVVVTGGSAGGHLTTLLALTANDPQFQPGFEEADTSVQAAVPFYGVYDIGAERGYYPLKTVRRVFARLVIKASPTRHPERFRAASAFEYLRADAPPFFVVHGTLDTLAPVQMARDFVAALREVSRAPVVYLELVGAQHAFEVLPSIRTRLVIRAVDRFLGALWDQHRAGPGEVDAERAEIG